jgi:hypothetical protein
MFYTLDLVIKTEIFNFLSQKDELNREYFFNYYNFNIVTQYRGASNLFTNQFFINLQQHKNKIFFYGYAHQTPGEEFFIFTLTSVVYDYPKNNLGLYVKKRITSEFKKININLIIDKKKDSNSKTIFFIR